MTLLFADRLDVVLGLTESDSPFALGALYRQTLSRAANRTLLLHILDVLISLSRLILFFKNPHLSSLVFISSCLDILLQDSRSAVDLVLQARWYALDFWKYHTAVAAGTLNRTLSPELISRLSTFDVYAAASELVWTLGIDAQPVDLENRVHCIGCIERFSDGRIPSLVSNEVGILHPLALAMNHDLKFLLSSSDLYNSGLDRGGENATNANANTPKPLIRDPNTRCTLYILAFYPLSDPTQISDFVVIDESW
ncbi:hypothetical protein D9757_007649 [Collybiopsis confluens]|uniref:Uncharacterized protein n=1 Tax=Collybiopsis confluens TaxID=2823264 RepID=A0A8H5H9U0_9AGAR|nr:hypothetical protein D9757_007649 [Collybiopsis confluens]